MHAGQSAQVAPSFVVTQRLLDLIARLLPVGFLVRKDEPITCADSEPEPDIAIVAGTREDYATAHSRTAEIVVEVSILTLERDVEKIGIYAEAGVKEYWLVIPEEKRVEIWSLPGKDGYAQCQRLGIEDGYRSTVIPELEVSFEDVLG